MWHRTGDRAAYRNDPPGSSDRFSSRASSTSTRLVVGQYMIFRADKRDRRAPGRG